MRNWLLLSGWQIKNRKEKAFRTIGFFGPFLLSLTFTYKKKKGVGQWNLSPVRTIMKIGDAIDILVIVLYYSLSRLPFQADYKVHALFTPSRPYLQMIYKMVKPLVFLSNIL